MLINIDTLISAYDMKIHPGFLLLYLEELLK